MKSNEISKILKVSKSTLHYYEHMGLITPKRNSNGYRIYQQSDIDTLKMIFLLKDLGFTLEDIRVSLQHFHYLQGELDNGMYESALGFLKTKKENFLQSIHLNQLAIQIIDTLFVNHQNIYPDKGTLVNEINKLTGNYWEIREKNNSMNEENLFKRS